MLAEVQGAMRQFVGKGLCALPGRMGVVDDDRLALVGCVAEPVSSRCFVVDRDSALDGDGFQTRQQARCVRIDDRTIDVRKFLSVGLPHVEHVYGLEEDTVDRFRLAGVVEGFPTEQAGGEDHNSAFALADVSA